jgi:hypothetical protein
VKRDNLLSKDLLDLKKYSLYYKTSLTGTEKLLLMVLEYLENKWTCIHQKKLTNSIVFLLKFLGVQFHTFQPSKDHFCLIQCVYEPKGQFHLPINSQESDWNSFHLIMCYPQSYKATHCVKKDKKKAIPVIGCEGP